MNLEESIYLMLLENELKKYNGNEKLAFYSYNKDRSEEEGCDVLEFKRKDLVEVAKDLANQIDKNSENVMLD